MSYRNKLKALLFSLSFIAVQVTAQSPKCLLQNYAIPDNRFVSIPIVFRGATSDLTIDKICKINLSFEHESVNQIRLTLVSPAGQRIELLGPATGVSNLTFPANKYDVSFVQCTNTAVPGPGYSAKWNNDQVWFGPNITGSYYPFGNCLESMNTGLINGTWYIEIEDVALFDKGKINCLSIEFCNNPNVVPDFCDQRVGQFKAISLVECFNKPFSLLDQVTFPNGKTASSTYTNTFVVMNGTSVVKYTPDTLGLLVPNLYTICQVSYLTVDSSNMPKVGSMISSGDFSSEFFKRGICGGVSLSCLRLDLRPYSDTVILPDIEICLGQEYDFRGKKFKQAGTYTVDVPSSVPNVCDTLYRFTITTFDLRAKISKDVASFSCRIDTVKLFPNKGLYSPTAKYAWSSATANSVARIVNDTAFVVNPADYKLIVTDRGCVHDTTITLTYDASAPTITIANPLPITCTSPEVTLSLSSTSTISSVNWSGNGIVQGNNFRVSQPGIYSATVIHTDGCKLKSMDIQVVKDTTVIKPILTSPKAELDCRDRTTSVSISNQSLFEASNLVFSRNGIVISDVSNLGVGKYTVTSNMKSNGCQVTSDSFEIVDGSYVPNLILETFCDGNNGLFIRAVDSVIGENRIRPILGFSWTVPTTAPPPVNATTQKLTTSGLYSFTLNNNDGCTADTSLNVNVADQYPKIDYLDRTISCTNKSTQLMQVPKDPKAIISWTGPYLFTSNMAEPIVSDLGFYFFSSKYSNGCSSLLDSALVGLDPIDSTAGFLPIINVVCSMDTTELVPDEQNLFSFKWRQDISPPIFTPLDQPIAKVKAPGTYRVEVTNKLTGCVFRREVTVGDKRDLPKISSAITIHTCELNTTSSINISSDKSVKILWKGPKSFTDDTLYIKDLLDGDYTYTITTANGCSLFDTFTIKQDIVLPKVTTKLRDTITCNRSSFNLNASVADGDLIRWFENSTLLAEGPTLTVNKPGAYIVKGINTVSKCESVPITVVVAIDTTTANIIVSIDSITCIKPDATLTFTSNIPIVSQSWTLAGNILSSLDTLKTTLFGQVSLTVQDSRGCTASALGLIEDVRDIVEYTKTITEIGCEDGIVGLNNTSGIESITWSGPQAITKNSFVSLVKNPGKYIFNMTSLKGCLFTDFLEITKDDALPIVSSKTSELLTCLNPTTNARFIVDQNILSVKWLDRDTVTSTAMLTFSKPGLQRVEITSLNKCKVLDSILIVQDIAKPKAILSTDIIICSRQAVFLTATPLIGTSPVISYEWKGPNGFTSMDSLTRTSVHGDYSAYLVGLNGCDTTLSISVIDNKVFPILVAPDTLKILCDEDRATLDVNVNQIVSRYRWSKGNALVSSNKSVEVDSAGKYYVNILSAEGCQALDSILVLVDKKNVQASITGGTLFCIPDSVILIAKPTLTAENYWLSPQNVITRKDTVVSKTPGIFKYIIRLNPNCVDTFNFNVVEDKVIPQITASQESLLLCDNKVVRLLGKPTHTRLNKLKYEWRTSNGNIIGRKDSLNIRVDAPGSYLIIAQDTVNNCSASLTLQVLRATNTFTDFLVRPAAPICFDDANGQIALISVSGGVRPHKLAVQGQGKKVSDSLFTNLTSGNYLVTVSDSFGCTLTKSVQIPKGFVFEVNLPADTSIRLGTTLDIGYTSDLLASQIASNSWSSIPIDPLNNCSNCQFLKVAPLDDIKVTLSLTDKNGCINSDTMMVRIIDAVSWTFPSVFKAGSATNGVFYLAENTSVEKIDEVVIYDRWGNAVWQTTAMMMGDATTGWAGDVAGSLALPGVYAVRVDATLKNGKKWTRTKSLTLLR